MSTEHAKKPQRLSIDFWKFWTGQAISAIGSSISLFALPLFIYALTHSALDLAIADAVAFLPFLLFGLIIGAWVDRTDRKRLMIGVDILRALLIGSIPALYALHQLALWWIFLVIFVHSTLTICFGAAEFAALPCLVTTDDIVTANGRIASSFAAASIIGPFLGGLLLAFMPLPLMLAFDALSFIISALSLAIITVKFNVEAGEQPARSSIWQTMIEGLLFVWGHPVLRSISIMMALVNLLLVTINAQLVLFAKHQFVASDTQVGWLFAAGSLGITAIAPFAGQLRKRWSFSVVALGSLMVEGLLLFALALIHWYWIAIVIWALSNGVGILFNVNTASIRQAIVPNNMLGRVMTIAMVLAWSANPIGTIIGGVIIQQTQNIAMVYASVGILVFLVACVFSFTALGHAQRFLPQPEAAQA